MIEFIYYFVLLSFCGWLIESLFVSIKTKKFVNRGMLYTPFIPIYGIVGSFVILLESKVELNLITWFFITCVIATIVEFLVSFIAEKIFNVHLWNYKDNLFNFQGRVCVSNTIMFGIIGTILVVLIPVIKQLYLYIPTYIWVILLVIIILDFIANFRMIQISKKEFTKELGSREFEFKLNKHHKPVSIKTLFIKRNDLIMKDLKERIDLEVRKLTHK